MEISGRRLFAVAARRVRKNGLGFVDYRGNFRGRFSAQARYGIAVVRPSGAVHQIETNPDYLRRFGLPNSLGRRPGPTGFRQTRY